jgi:hypothetical protein
LYFYQLTYRYPAGGNDYSTSASYPLSSGDNKGDGFFVRYVKNN